MERSESIKEIANALCKFQQEVGKVKKTAKIPTLKVNMPHWQTYWM